MTITPPQLEAVFYNGLRGVRTISLKDSGAVEVDLTLSASAPVSDALLDWQTQANASGDLNGTYTFQWLPGVQKISFLCSETFNLTLWDSLPTALGYSSPTHSGSSSYASDLTPRAVANVIGIDYDVHWPMRETNLARRRFGRAIGRAHFRAMSTVLRITMESAQALELMAGPMFAGAVRAYPTGYTSGPYSGAPGGDLRGYHQVYSLEITRGRPYGSEDSLTDVEVVAAVEGA